MTRLLASLRADSDSARAVAHRDSIADSVRAADAARADSVRLASRDTIASPPRARRHTSHAPAHVARRVHRGTPAPSDWHGPIAQRAMALVPLPGSLFPGCRVVAYYGNPLSRRMGILGEISPDSMMARLDREVAAWQRADSATPTIGALELIATVAQGSAGRDSLYRLRMPDTLIARVASWAARRGYLLILDVQVGRSSVRSEIARLVPYLARPSVHLALDPEFAMPRGKVPGHVIGTLDASEVNFAVDTLAGLVRAYDLPPKMLIVHRFTRPMLTHQERIRLDPRVQVVIDMDGFGPPSLKRSSYDRYVMSFPVQFTGFKLFYKNDRPILTPQQVLRLMPIPVFVMYQ